MMENAISSSSLYNPGSTLNYSQAAMMGLSGSHGGLQDPQQLGYTGHGGIPNIILTGKAWGDGHEKYLHRSPARQGDWAEASFFHRSPDIPATHCNYNSGSTRQGLLILDSVPTPAILSHCAVSLSTQGTSDHPTAPSSGSTLPPWPSQECALPWPHTTAVLPLAPHLTLGSSPLL